MKAVKSIVSLVIFYSISISSAASELVSQDSGSEIGNMMLMSAGVVGLLVARKHTKTSS